MICFKLEAEEFFNYMKDAVIKDINETIKKYKLDDIETYANKLNEIGKQYGVDAVIEAGKNIEDTVKSIESSIKKFDFSQGVSIGKVMDAATEIEIIHSTFMELKDETTSFASSVENVFDKISKTKVVFPSEEEINKFIEKLAEECISYFTEKLDNYLKEKNIDVEKLKNTYEYIALLLMCYEEGLSAIGAELIDALKKGDRFKAWFEIRYNSNINNLLKIAEKLISQSNLFGIFENINANKALLSNKEITKDMISFDDVVNIFSHLNFEDIVKDCSLLSFIDDFELNKIFYNEKYDDKDENEKEENKTPINFLEKILKSDVVYQSCRQLIEPVFNFVNEFAGNIVTDAAGKLISSFDLENIFVVKTQELSANSLKFQQMLQNRVMEFLGLQEANENAGNTPTNKNLNFLVMLQGINVSGIDFGSILSLDKHSSLTLVLSEASVIDVKNIAEENLNLVYKNPKNPSLLQHIKGKLEEIVSDDKSLLKFKFQDSAFKAVYKLIDGCLSIFDEDDNKVVDIINYIPGMKKACIESDEFIPKESVKANQSSGSFEYKCDIKVNGKGLEDYNVFNDAPFYLYLQKTQELFETTIQAAGEKLSATFKLNIDKELLENTKVMFLEDKADLEVIDKIGKAAASLGLISKNEVEKGIKEGIYSLMKPLTVTGCEIVSQTDTSVTVAAKYNYNISNKYYKEKAQETLWGYIIEDNADGVKNPSLDKILENVLDTKGSEITINFDKLNPKYTEKMSMNIYPYLKTPETNVFCSITGTVLDFEITGCQVINDKNGAFKVKAIYNKPDMKITDDINRNTHWLIAAFNSSVSESTALDMINNYHNQNGYSIQLVQDKDYILERISGSEVDLKIKDCTNWVDRRVYFLPYKSKIDKKIHAVWNLSQPFYLKFNGKMLSICNTKDNAVIYKTDAYSGEGVSEKNRESDYQIQEVNINNKPVYFYYDKEKQQEKDTGPVPEGEYYIDIDNVSSYGFFYHIIYKYLLMRTPLYSSPALDSSLIKFLEYILRDKFYIHGGSTFLDNKGIELSTEFQSFFKIVDKAKKVDKPYIVKNRTPICVRVEYEKNKNEQQGS